ncbi:HAD hydrolase-like protein [Jatrophihabitans telluris]|uniref:HAD hydrolase-like protein n=1 Tax=Jatrophihabitans telluris TaxID=2038343 RepID=A0ABY4R1V9_9ACTN|nr:HAD hydrolase-like protein [Jatrophihabitans telluris]UQX89913.1 HAD hydrolase-like protein [Jatrophihabitans telluris]
MIDPAPFDAAPFDPAPFDTALFDTVLFDLDGTLSDSAPGILGCLRQAFDELGVPWPDEAVARSLLGPPFWHTLPPLVGADRTERAIEIYREHYVVGGGMFQTRAYDGVAPLLQSLRSQSVRLAVATSKPEIHAGTIVEHLGFSEHFDFVCGDTLDGARDSKALVIAEALNRMGDPPAGTVLMVGDRSHDVLGAAANGLHSVGVLWGYGSATELHNAGAAAVIERPAQLNELLRP